MVPERLGLNATCQLVASRDLLAAWADEQPDPNGEDVRRAMKAYHALAELVGYPADER